MPAKTVLLLSVIFLPLCALLAQNPPPPKPAVSGDAEKLPTVLHFCGQHCITFTLENGQLINRTNLIGQQNVKRVLTVESFTRDNVIIHRLDTGLVSGKPVSNTTDYTGRMSDNGNSLSGNGWKMTWGAALNDIAGDDNDQYLRTLIATAPHAQPPNTAGTVDSGAEIKGGATPALGPLPVPDFGDLKIEPPHAGDPDIGGIWQQDAEPASRYSFPPVKMLLVAFRNQLVAVNLERVPFLGPSSAFMTGTYSAPDTFNASVKDFTDSGVVGWYKSDLSFPSDGHLRIVVKAFNEERRFTRISRIAPGEVACNPRNPTHVSALEAVARSFVYHVNKDDRTATCWRYIGANGEDVVAEQLYGDALLEGKYVKKDEAQAIRLYQRSAMQGNSYAADRLADAFDKGFVVPESEQRKNYWLARAYWLDPDYVHTKTFLRITQWAADTALPCDPAKAPASGDTIFRAGRVAFEARAGDVAECWFKISSARGNLRADTYLGVMYYFGLGVAQDFSLGLEHLKKASDGKDPFGMLYLADLLRFGIGLKANDFNLLLGISMMQEMQRMPNGPEVMTRVEGINGLRSLLTSPVNRQAERCQQLLATARSNPTVENRYAARGCDDSDDIGGIMGAMSHNRHTVEHPEEIFPEIFDPITLPADGELKDKAARGMGRVTP